jgi:hypothetical protein
MWPGVMPSKGQVNTTYLDQLEMLVNQLGQQVRLAALSSDPVLLIAPHRASTRYWICIKT